MKILNFFFGKMKLEKIHTEPGSGYKSDTLDVLDQAVDVYSKALEERTLAAAKRNGHIWATLSDAYEAINQHEA